MALARVSGESAYFPFPPFNAGVYHFFPCVPRLSSIYSNLKKKIMVDNYLDGTLDRFKIVVIEFPIKSFLMLYQFEVPKISVRKTRREVLN